MRIGFRFVILAFVLACTTPAFAQQGPAESTVWTPAGSKSYEESNPGMGSSLHFSSRYGWIDVFSYGLGRSDWETGVADPQFDAVFASVVASVRQLSDQGVLLDFRTGETHDISIAGQRFRAVEFTFTLRGEASESAALLTARGGQILKYRITVKASGPPVMQLAEEFVARDLPARPVSP